jgi:hypothetical protein
MFSAVHRVGSVRQTRSRSGNASRWHVGRISVSGSLFAAFLLGGTFVVAAPPAQDSWTIRIVPATKLGVFPPMMAPQRSGGRAPATDRVPPQPYEPSGPRAQEGPGAVPPMPADMPIHGVPYVAIYRSIPFSRAEYAANPSYRNQTTLGILFNQMPYPPSVKSLVPAYGYPVPPTTY